MLESSKHVLAQVPVRTMLRAWLAFAAVAIVAVGIATLARRSRPKVEPPPVLGQIPSFAMHDQRGRLVSDESLRGSALVVDFFYATCTTSCPMLTARMKRVEGALADRERALARPLGVKLVSITLDPENDTPDVLRAYAESHGVDESRWSFLSGRSAELDRVVVGGFKMSYARADPAAGIAAIMHGEWLVLVDPTGAIRGYYAAADAERMDALVRDAEALASGATVPAVTRAQPPTASAPAAAPRTWHATGVIKSFGPNGAFVNIAHDDIPGYMAAMTMSFEPAHPGQLDGLAATDKVVFDFTETDDARRVLARIGKRP